MSRKWTQAGVSCWDLEGREGNPAGGSSTRRDTLVTRKRSQFYEFASLGLYSNPSTVTLSSLCGRKPIPHAVNWHKPSLKSSFFFADKQVYKQLGIINAARGGCWTILVMTIIQFFLVLHSNLMQKSNIMNSGRCLMKGPTGRRPFCHIRYQHIPINLCFHIGTANEIGTNLVLPSLFKIDLNQETSFTTPISSGLKFRKKQFFHLDFKR